MSFEQYLAQFGRDLEEYYPTQTESEYDNALSSAGRGTYVLDSPSGIDDAFFHWQLNNLQSTSDAALSLASSADNLNIDHHIYPWPALSNISNPSAPLSTALLPAGGEPEPHGESAYQDGNSDVVGRDNGSLQDVAEAPLTRSGAVSQPASPTTAVTDQRSPEEATHTSAQQALGTAVMPTPQDATYSAPTSDPALQDTPPSPQATTAEIATDTSADPISATEEHQPALQEIANVSTNSAPVLGHSTSIQSLLAPFYPHTAPQEGEADKENVSVGPPAIQKSTQKRRYNQMDDSTEPIMGSSSGGNSSSSALPVMVTVNAKRQRIAGHANPQLPTPPVVYVPPVVHVPTVVHTPAAIHAPSSIHVPTPVPHTHPAAGALRVIVHPLPRSRYRWHFHSHHTPKAGLATTKVINGITYTIDSNDMCTWGAESRPSGSTNSTVHPLPNLDNIYMVCLLCDNKVFSSNDRARSLNSHFNNVHCDKIQDPCYAAGCTTTHARNSKQNNVRRRHLLGSSEQNSHKVTPSAKCQEQIAMGKLKECVDLSSQYVQDLLEEVTEQYLLKIEKPRLKIETQRWMRKWLGKLAERREDQF